MTSYRLSTEIRTAGLSPVATTITLALLRVMCSELGPHNSHAHRFMQPNSQPRIVAYLLPTSFPLPSHFLPLSSYFPSASSSSSHFPPASLLKFSLPPGMRLILIVIYIHVPGLLSTFFLPSVPALRLTLRSLLRGHDCVPWDHDSIKTLNALVHNPQA